MQLLYVDLFCGAGGTSTGVNTARIKGNQCARVIACVNHDSKAIASHAANHPDALHFTEDIRTLELAPLVSHIKCERTANPLALTVLWASLECTNFSKAKGGQPRDADSRTLAEHLFRYIEAIEPDYIQIENVEEFMSWGDIDEKGKPISKDKGRCYIRWVNKVKKYGYDFDYRIMNAANYGAYTSRKRFFGIFAKRTLPIVFPEPTHCKKPKTGLFDENLKKWNPVKDCIDFSNEGNTIFREKPLSEKTLERIYAGLIKFVADGKEAFMIKYNSVNQKTGKYCPPSLEEPCPVVTTQNRLALARVSFLSKQFGGNPKDKNISIEQPAGTITTIDHHAFITVYYSNGQNVSLGNPSPTLMTKDKFGLVRMCFMDMQFGNGTPMSLDVPTGTIMTNPKQKLVSVIPCTTGEIGISVYETDSPMTVKIKEFMALYGIIDIKMRMLTISELKKIMGFPEDYILIGTQADQKKFIGNAVEVTIARVWCESLCSSLKNFDIKKYQSQKKAS